MLKNLKTKEILVICSEYRWHWDSAKMELASHLGVITALLHLYEVHSIAKIIRQAKN